MSVVDTFGVRVVQKEDPYKDDVIERARSLDMAVRLRKGWPVEKVARYFGVHRTTVWRRARSVPAEAAERASRIMV